jgi:hypothetical protein
LSNPRMTRAAPGNEQRAGHDCDQEAPSAHAQTLGTITARRATSSRSGGPLAQRSFRNTGPAECAIGRNYQAASSSRSSRRPVVASSIS